MNELSPVRLTDAEVKSLADVVERMKGDVPAVVESIITARMAETTAALDAAEQERDEAIRARESDNSMSRQAIDSYVRALAITREQFTSAHDERDGLRDRVEAALALADEWELKNIRAKTIHRWPSAELRAVLSPEPAGSE